MRFIILVVVVVTALPIVVSADVLNVPEDYSTIQGAIGVAVNGDTVLVDSGTYEEILDFSGKNITVKSANGPEATVIDAKRFSSSSVVTFKNHESSQAILEGFTLINGTGSLYEYEPGNWALCGGGIFCLNASPTIRGNIISNNHVEYIGGGIFISDSVDPVISQNQIINNSSDYITGAIYGAGIESLTVFDNDIRQNTAESHAAVYCCLLYRMQSRSVRE